MKEDKLSIGLLSDDQRLGFRDQLREARSIALKDAEAFTEILFVIERLGAALVNKSDEKTFNLGTYEKYIKELIDVNISNDDRSNLYHTPFKQLYKLVKEARNDALHQGAQARHITTHTIRLSIMIEDALTIDKTTVSDYMVRSPIIASKWHPVSYVRQMMLENSFSFIPFYDEDKKKWLLISDVKVAHYLQSERKLRLAHCLGKVFKEIEHSGKIRYCKERDTISDLMKQKKLSVEPCLIHHPKDKSHLLGLITAFDIL